MTLTGDLSSNTLSSLVVDPSTSTKNTSSTSLLCQFLLGSTNNSSSYSSSIHLPSTGSSSCPLTSSVFNGDQGYTNEGWLAFISQLGFTNGHALLALFGLIFAFINHFRVLSKYRRLTSNSDFGSLSEFQKFHLVFHYALMTGCTVFIAGMVTNVLNVKPAWIILAAVTEVVFFGVQFVLLLTALRSWLFRSKRKCGQLSLIILIFYIIPSLIYVVSISFLSSIIAAGSTTIPANIGTLVQVMFIILHCLRGVTSLAFLLISTGAQNYYSLFETTTERKLKWANIVQSIFSLVYNILSICFTLGFFCPQFGHVWIRYVEWYYLANLTVLVMYCCSVESGNEADLDAVSDASNTRPVKEIQTPVVRVLNVVNSTSSSSYMRPPRPDHGLSGISDRRQSTLLSLPSSSSQPNSRRQSINPANHHNNQISSALLTVINNNSNRGEVSRSTSFFSRFTSFSRRRDHQLDELIRQSSQATVMLDDYGRQVDISTRHQRQELGLSSENTIATTPRRYFFLTPIFFDFNLTIPIEIAGFAITLFISLAIFAIHLLDIFYLRDAKSGVPTVLLTLYAIFTFFQVGFKVLNSPTTTTTAMMANQNSPRHYLWRVLLAIVLIVGVVVPFLVVPSYAFYLSYGLLPLITLLWASSTTVKGKSRFAQLVLPAKTPRSMWRTSDSSLFGNNGERDQHRSNAVSTSRTSFGSGPRATRTRPSTTSVVSWGGSAAQSSRGTGLLNNNGVGSGVGDFSWGFSSTVAAASPHLKTKILKMLISMYMVFATCVASVAGQYLPVAVSACLVCVAWLFGLRRQPENSNAILRQILLWATGITFVVLFIVLSQIPFLLVSSSTSWMALKGKVAVFGYLSDGTIANLPSVIVDAGGVGAYFTLNMFGGQNSNISNTLLTSMTQSQGYMIGEIGDSISSLSPLTNFICNSNAAVQNQIVEPVFITTTSLSTLANLLYLTNGSNSIIGMRHGIGQQTPLDLTLSSRYDSPYLIDVIESEMFILNPYLGLALSRRGRRQIIVISENLNTLGSNTNSLSLNQMIISMGLKMNVFAYALTDWKSSINSYGAWSNGQYSNFWPSSYSPGSPAPSISNNQTSSAGDIIGNSGSVNSSKLIAAALPVPLVTLFVFGMLITYMKWDNVKTYSRRWRRSRDKRRAASATARSLNLSKNYYEYRDDNDGDEDDDEDENDDGDDDDYSDSESAYSVDSDHRGGNTRMTGGFSRRELVSKAILLLQEEQSSIQWTVFLLEMLSIVGWLISVISIGNLTSASNVTSILTNFDLIFAFVVLGGTSSVINMGSSLILKFQRFRVLFVVKTALTCLAIIFSGYTLQYMTVNGESSNVSTRLVMIGSCLFAAGKMFSISVQNCKYSKIRADQEYVVGGLALMYAAGWIMGMSVIVRLTADLSQVYLMRPFIPIFISVGILSTLLALLSLFYNYRWLNGFVAAFIMASFFVSGTILSEARIHISSCTLNGNTLLDCTYEWPLLLSGGIVSCVLGFFLHVAKNWYFESIDQTIIRVQINLQVQQERARQMMDVRHAEKFGGGGHVGSSLHQFTSEPTFLLGLTRNRLIWNIWRFVMGTSLLLWILFISGVGSLSSSDPLEIIVSGVVGAISGLIFLALISSAAIKDSRHILSSSLVFIFISLLFSGNFIFLSCQRFISFQGGTEAALACGVFGAIGLGVCQIALFSSATHRLFISPRLTSSIQRKRNLILYQMCWIPLLIFAVSVGVVFQDMSYNNWFAKAGDRLAVVSALVFSSLAITLAFFRYAYYKGEMLWTLSLPTFAMLVGLVPLGNVIFRASQGTAPVCPNSNGSCSMRQGMIAMLASTVIYTLIALASTGYLIQNAQSLNQEPFDEDEERDRKSRWTLSGPSELMQINNWIQGRLPVEDERAINRKRIFTVATIVSMFGWLVFVASQGAAAIWTANEQLFAASCLVGLLLYGSVYAHWVGIYISGVVACFISVSLFASILFEKLTFFQPQASYQLAPPLLGGGDYVAIVGASIYYVSVIVSLFIYFTTDSSKPLDPTSSASTATNNSTLPSIWKRIMYWLIPVLSVVGGGIQLGGGIISSSLNLIEPGFDATFVCLVFAVMFFIGVLVEYLLPRSSVGSSTTTLRYFRRINILIVLVAGAPSAGVVFVRGCRLLPYSGPISLSNNITNGAVGASISLMILGSFLVLLCMGSYLVAAAVADSTNASKIMMANLEASKKSHTSLSASNINLVGQVGAKAKRPAITRANTLLVRRKEDGEDYQEDEDQGSEGVVNGGDGKDVNIDGGGEDGTGGEEGVEAQKEDASEHSAPPLVPKKPPTTIFGIKIKVPNPVKKIIGGGSKATSATPSSSTSESSRGLFSRFTKGLSKEKAATENNSDATGSNAAVAANESGEKPTTTAATTKPQAAAVSKTSVKSMRSESTKKPTFVKNGDDKDNEVMQEAVKAIVRLTSRENLLEEDEEEEKDDHGDNEVQEKVLVKSYAAGSTTSRGIPAMKKTPTLPPLTPTTPASKASPPQQSNLSSPPKATASVPPTSFGRKKSTTDQPSSLLQAQPTAPLPDRQIDDNRVTNNNSGSTNNNKREQMSRAFQGAGGGSASIVKSSSPLPPPRVALPPLKKQQQQQQQAVPISSDTAASSTKLAETLVVLEQEEDGGEEEEEEVSPPAGIRNSTSGGASKWIKQEPLDISALDDDM